MPKLRSTTILAVSHKGVVAMGGDGQVTLGETAVKHTAKKIRRLHEGKVLVGFAGGKLKDFQGSVPRAATELAKEWRTDRVLRRLESLLAVADRENLLLISGGGDVIAPDDGVVGIGSGGAAATAAARALVRHSDLEAPQIVEEALKIAAEICVFTNDRIYVETIP